MKTLAIDIETSPHLVYTWGLHNQYISPDQIVTPTRVLCFAAAWIGEGRRRAPIEFHDSWHEGGHEAMIAKAHELFDQADAVVHYNGKSFDVPHLEREFLEAGLRPPSPFKQVDLFYVAKRFRFPSHRLQYITTTLGLKGKVGHEGFLLWPRVMAGDELAQRRMQRYNVQDVRLLEELHDIVLPWIPRSAYPNRALIDGAPAGACPRCSSTHVQKRGFVSTQVSTFRQFQCQACGHWFRSAKREPVQSIVRDVAA